MVVLTPGDTVDDSTQNGLVVGYHPDQPIDFNHKLHAGERKIDCQFCHTGARRSSSAVIPQLIIVWVVIKSLLRIKNP